jgi:16S rRNA (guanine966-N2)-methyltransferase
LVQTGRHFRGRAPGRGTQSRILRIIGGSWRGRKLRFPADAAIRPTPDRVRETLFNWLQTRVPGSRCLDLFAGSGALGLEALSRGARHVTFVEHDAAAARALRNLLTEWQAPDAEVEQTDALRYLGRPGEPFDIVFLDPPFAAGLLAPALERLQAWGRLAPDALVYIEYPAHQPPPPVPEGWTRARTKQAGEVGYDLWAIAIDPRT